MTSYQGGRSRKGRRQCADIQELVGSHLLGRLYSSVATIFKPALSLEVKERLCLTYVPIRMV